jgi:hypothetical protein
MLRVWASHTQIPKDFITFVLSFAPKVIAKNKTLANYWPLSPKSMISKYPSVIESGEKRKNYLLLNISECGEAQIMIPKLPGARSRKQARK